jgi:biotin transport system substrate-specific component
MSSRHHSALQEGSHVSTSVPAYGPSRLSTTGQRRAVLADRLAPSRLDGRTRDLVLIVGVAAFTALMAQVSFHIPGTPVPITGQTFAVLLSASAVGPLRGVLGQLLYIAVGWAGLPVFSSGTHGWAVVHGVNAGYLLGFVLASALVGWQARRGLDRRADTLAGSFLLGSALIYLPGVWWLQHQLHLSYSAAMTAGVYPFLFGDLIKALLAGALLPSAWRLVGRSSGSGS